MDTDKQPKFVGQCRKGFAAEVIKHFPAAIEEPFIIRQKPNSSLTAREGIGIKQRDRKSANGHIS
jgi:hypothetical protein